MIDPKEKEAEAQEENVEQQGSTGHGSNWNERQSVD